jgi:hypothetical protein
MNKKLYFVLLTSLAFILSCNFYYHNNKPYGSNYRAPSGIPGYITQDDIKSANNIKKKVQEGSTQVAEVSKHVYTFGYFPSELSKGRPIKAFENTYQKFRMLSDAAPFYFTEVFNDMVSFESFKVKIGDQKLSRYHEPIYLIADYTNDGIFYSDAKLAYWEYPLTGFGTPLHLRYKKKVKDVKYLTSAYFHDNYPTKEKVISIEIPSWLEVEIIEKNFEGYSITKTSKKVNMEDVLESNVEEDKEPGDKSSKRDRTKVITYTLKDVKAIKKENHASGISYNLPHLIILCKKYEEKTAKSFALKEKPEKRYNEKKLSKNDPLEAKRRRQQGNYKTPLISNLDDLYQWYAEIAALTKNDTSIIGNKAREIIGSSKDPKDKMEKIFYWVQDHIRYVAFEDGLAAFKPDACQDVLSNRYGDCKGMANLLTNMLLTVGLDARLTWIGTNHLNYDYRIPSVMVDNHMICTVILDGKKYFLDATEDYIGLEDYAYRIQGRPVLISDGKKYMIDTVPNLGVDRNISYKKAILKIDPSSQLVGKAKETLKGEPKTQALWAINNLPRHAKKDALKRYLGNQYHDLIADSIETSDLSKRNQDFEINYVVTYKNQILKKNGLTLLQIPNDRISEIQRLDTSRMFNYTFSHSLNQREEILVQIPTGQSVKYLPAPIKVQHPEFTLDITYTIEGQFIKYVRVFTAPKGSISKSNFKEWNQMVHQLQKSSNEYVQLK